MRVAARVAGAGGLAGVVAEDCSEGQWSGPECCRPGAEALGPGSRRWRESSSDATIVDQALLRLDRSSAPCAYRFAARPRPHREGRPSVKRSRIVRRRGSCASFRATRTRARRCFANASPLRDDSGVSGAPRPVVEFDRNQDRTLRGLRCRGLLARLSLVEARLRRWRDKRLCPLIPADRRIDPYRLCQRRAARSGDAIRERRGIVDTIRKHDSSTGRHRLHCAGCRRDGHRRSR